MTTVSGGDDHGAMLEDVVAFARRGVQNGFRKNTPSAVLILALFLGSPDGAALAVRWWLAVAIV